MIPTILICVGLGIAVAAIIVYLIRQKKAGKSACSCGCSHCAMSDICHKKK